MQGEIPAGTNEGRRGMMDDEPGAIYQQRRPVPYVPDIDRGLQEMSTRTCKTISS